VIVLHELERALNHCVLKINGRIECRDFARKMLTDAEVFRSPPNNLVWPDKARRHATNRLLARLLSAQQMHLDAT